MARHSHRVDVRAALLSGLLIAMTLSVSACGGADSTHAPGRTTTTGHNGSPATTASPPSGMGAVRPGAPRTPAAVVKHFVGRRITVAGHKIRIDADTVTCGGVGRPSARIHDQDAWTRFRCIQPTFPPGRLVGPDLIFVVQSVWPRDLVVTRRHLTSY